MCVHETVVKHPSDTRLQPVATFAVILDTTHEEMVPPEAGLMIRMFICLYEFDNQRVLTGDISVPLL